MECRREPPALAAALIRRHRGGQVERDGIPRLLSPVPEQFQTVSRDRSRGLGCCLSSCLLFGEDCFCRLRRGDLVGSVGDGGLNAH